MLKWILLTLLIPVILPTANACDSVNLGIKSYHWKRDTDYNESNVGIGCTNILGNWDILYFENTKKRDTFFFGNEWVWKKSGSWKVGVDFGILIHGYSDKYPFVPIGLPKLTYKTRLVNFNTYLLLNQGIAVGLEFRL